MIKTEIKVPLNYKTEDIKKELCVRLPISSDEASSFKIIKRTLVVSEDSGFFYKMSVALSLFEDRERGLLKMKKKVSAMPELRFTAPISRLASRPVVVGAGPCGLFAGLTLAEGGARPIILERGLPVSLRGEKVKMFSRLMILDPECNVQFGEGGAGAYSDGKLKVGSMDKYKYKVLSEFNSAGADDEIMYSSSAHIGTDKLSGIIENIREKIISLGGEFVFSAKLTDINIKDGKAVSLLYLKDGEEHEIAAENIILATGHSATDVFTMLRGMNVEMKAKGFGIGVRIEHPREYINDLVYGKSHPSELESASYHLVTHLGGGRSVYSFCMCPGGSVVAAASEKGGVVTNGMSENARMGDNSNAAFLVSLTPEDFPSDSPLSGIDLQRKIEGSVYSLTSSYKAPVCTLSDFAEKKAPKALGSVKPTYSVGTELFSPEKYLPEYVTESLRAAVSDFDAWMPGFYYGDAVITGAETRSTSPVRITRNEKYETPSVKGLYPAGEGAGYSGGIVSSAADGIRCAEALLLK